MPTAGAKDGAVVGAERVGDPVPAGRELEGGVVGLESPPGAGLSLLRCVEIWQPANTSPLRRSDVRRATAILARPCM
jgi:hypothetical protein